MIDVFIPGKGQIQLKHLVLDVNGTLAVDGKILDGVAPQLARLKDHLDIHLATADTYGQQKSVDQALGLEAFRLSPGNEDQQKAAFVRQLGAVCTAAIGQGANDALMLQEAILGICVLSREGTAASAWKAADILMPDIFSALELFEKPARMTATLRT